MAKAKKKEVDNLAIDEKKIRDIHWTNSEKPNVRQAEETAIKRHIEHAKAQRDLKAGEKLVDYNEWMTLKKGQDAECLAILTGVDGKKIYKVKLPEGDE